MAATTIQLKPETRQALKSIGGKGQTYDEIIQDLLAVYEARLEELGRRLKAPKEEYIPLEELERKWGMAGATPSRRVSNQVHAKTGRKRV